MMVNEWQYKWGTDIMLDIVTSAIFLWEHGQVFYSDCCCSFSSSFIDERLKKSSEKLLSDLQKALQTWAEKRGFTLEKKTAKMRARDRKAVCKCFHGVGVVVPVDENGVGHRPLPETQGLYLRIRNKLFGWRLIHIYV